VVEFTRTPPGQMLKSSHLTAKSHLGDSGIYQKLS